jgi:tellurite resistance-related uncharacterized protein
MPALPADVRRYKRSATFTDTTVPSGLLRDHQTKPGVWARIVIETGTIEYTLGPPPLTFVLTSEYPGIIPPTVPHQVRVIGPVSFYVEFLKSDEAPSTT